MSLQDVYLRAAELIATKQATYSCLAIKTALGEVDAISYDRLPEVQLYMAYFNDNLSPESFMALVHQGARHYKGRQQLRVLMLCMMAAIVSRY